MSIVKPRTYFVGETVLDMGSVEEYLRATNQMQFIHDISAARDEGLTDGEIMTSMFAKLCYSSLVPGKNDNLSSSRDIPSNLSACLEHGHGSVFEHCNLNFITRDCSRVFTHELVRHRAGCAFSQQSGRYVMSLFDFVNDPILDPVGEMVEAHVDQNDWSCERIRESLFNHYKKEAGVESDNDLPMKLRKELTSALRRLRLEGRANEIAWSMNLRALRHTIQMRTSEHAEWEIRQVFTEVFRLVNAKYPTIFADATTKILSDDSLVVSGMRTQPYEKQ